MTGRRPSPEQINKVVASMNSLFNEGFLDPDKEEKMMRGIMDDFFRRETAFPKVIADYIDQSKKAVHNIQGDLYEEPDCVKTDKKLLALMNNSESVGALKVHSKLAKAREFWDKGRVEDYKKALKEVKEEIDNLNEKLQPYFELLKVDDPPDRVRNF